LLDPFLPDSLDTFTILTAGVELLGALENAVDGGRLMTLGNKGSFLVNYSAATDTVVLSDFFVGLLGDYNNDDILDAADYTVWRDALTAGATFLPNDPTPGSVDESDFLYWRAHFGELLGSGSGAGSAAIPEPSTAALLFIAITSLGCLAQRRVQLTATSHSVR